jgi:lipoprotein-anchoring transpeptidase ErfK/SrfK
MYYNLGMKLSVIGGTLLGLGLVGLAGLGGSGAAAAANGSTVTPYAALAQRQSGMPVLPKAIVLKAQGREVSLKPSQLGIKIDGQKVAAAASQKGLPLKGGAKSAGPETLLLAGRNFFGSYNKPVYVEVDQSVLTAKLSAMAKAGKQAPVDASIITQGQTYVISPSAAGRQIDVGRAAAAVNRAVLDGKTVVSLPVVSLQPTVTEVSLQPKLQQMKDQQAVAAAAAAAAKQAALAKAVTPTSCADNTSSQLILVSISRQHMWACQGSSQVYDSAITSGAYLAGDATPTGTWHIYSKSTNVNLIGPGWDDFVNYWMPFYSDYGFHDSSWQTFPYGDPSYASQGSHGCVHLPLAAMAWLYGWSHIGTTVTVTG